MGDHQFPYAYYSCPCVDISAELPALEISRRAVKDLTAESEADHLENGQQFDPRSPRADLSLVPLEYLLWCTECHEMRCNRCVLEEIVCWYCPTCLFEVPSSTVRTEGNRCTRSCYNCPICTSPLTVNAMDTSLQDHKSDTPTGPFILMCGWCHWSTLDIQVQFDKSNNLTAQLGKIKSSRRLHKTDAIDDTSSDRATTTQASKLPKPEEMFELLTAFYRQQVTDMADAGYSGSLGASESAFASPSTISRLLNMYSSKRTKRTKPKPIREASSGMEGLFLVDESAEHTVIDRQSEQGLAGTTDSLQRSFQPDSSPRFVRDLWPVASLLRTKRQKRCKSCRTLLVKPEARVTSSRWKIRLLALNHIPKISIRALSMPAALGPFITASAASNSSFEYDLLHQGRTYQFLLTAINPVFDPVSITLATATTTPGRVASRVTILCPQFTVGANSDVWDEALGTSSKRRSVMPGSTQQPLLEEESDKQAEVGQVWRKGRNWVSIIVEIVPGLLPEPTSMEKDEDLLEIAVLVRAEYETASAGDDRPAGPSATKEKRETTFWTILGVGRIRPP